MLERERILKRYRDEERDIIARALDFAENVYRTHHVKITDFYDPYHTGLIISELESLTDLSVDTDGGYPGAERTRIYIFPEYLDDPGKEKGLSFIDIEGNFGMGRLQHRDFLGSLTGLGLKRGKIGDILVGEGAAQIVAAREVSEYIVLNLSRVGRLGVRVREISREELKIPEKRVKEIHTTVASLRADVMAAAGFGTSRNRMTREILGEKLNINWQTCTDLSKKTLEGDVLSIRGRGRVEVAEIKGNTKKGRIAVVLKRYI